jgi:ComF family protein
MPFAELALLLRRAEGWLLPGECLLCRGSAGPDDSLICGACQARWHRLPEPQCLRCGQPITPLSDGCRVCVAWLEGLGCARSAVWLDSRARAAVHALKYGGWWRVADPMARLLARLDPIRRPGLLVPVPLAASRARARGYNQAEQLARCLAARTGLPVRSDLLVRTRETPTQTALPPQSRRANVAAAFAAGPVPAGSRVVLVDDVFTTGATLAEAAATLVEAGAEAVEAVTFARATPPVF